MESCIGAASLTIAIRFDRNSPWRNALGMLGSNLMPSLSAALWWGGGETGGYHLFCPLGRLPPS